MQHDSQQKLNFQLENVVQVPFHNLTFGNRFVTNIQTHFRNVTDWSIMAELQNLRHSIIA